MRLISLSCLSVRLELRDSHWTDFHKIWYSSTFENLSRIVFAGLVGPQVAEKSPCIFIIQMCSIFFMSTCYMSPIQSHTNPLHHLPSRVLQGVSFLIVSIPKPCMHFSSTPHIPHGLHIPFFVISSPELLGSKNHEATHDTIPLISLLHPPS